MTNKPKKTPVPREHVQQFHYTIEVLAESCRINKIPEIRSYIDLLGEACQRYGEDKEVIQKKKQSISALELRRFIKIWQERYMQECDVEYGKLDKAEHAAIKNIIKKISEQKLEVSDFLKWVYEDFLPANPKLHPDIKLVGSNGIVRKFIAAYIDKSKQRKASEMRNIEFIDLSNRIKSLAENASTKNLARKGLKSLNSFKEGDIMIDELRKDIQSLERQAKRQQRQ